MNIAAIGSCRVYGPMRESALDGGGYEYHQLFGHTHNPQEIYQGLRILAADLVVSQEIGTFMNINNVRKVSKRYDFRKTIEACDAVVVEISSLRTIQYKDFSFQKNTFSNKLAEAGLEPRVIQDLHRGGEAAEVARAVALETLEPGLLRDIVEHSRFHELSEEEIESYMEKIVDFIGRPVLFVGVVDIYPEKPNTAVRAKLTRTLRRFCEGRETVDFFNPSEFVTPENYDTIMRGSSHYQPDAIASVGHRMSRRAKELAERVRASFPASVGEPSALAAQPA